MHFLTRNIFFVLLEFSVKISSTDIVSTLHILKNAYPEAGALDIGSTFQMLVAVVLSARTKDEQVLLALPHLFSRFPTPDLLAQADITQVEACISRIGLYKSKARYIVALSQQLLERFSGTVPATLHELVSLPGVGRKTASVLLAARFATPAIAVDTHVYRIAQRLGWARAASILSLEKKLLRVVPESSQALVNTVMVPFGRAICTAGTPRCWVCPVAHLCAFPKKNLSAPKNADALLAQSQQQREALQQLTSDVAYAIS